MSLQPEPPPGGEGREDLKRKREEPRRPARPVSTRRDAVVNLERPVHPDVLALLQQRAATLVTNHDLYAAADPAARTTASADPAVEGSREVAERMHDAMRQAKRRRVDAVGLSGQAETGESGLTHNGRQESVKAAFREFAREGDRTMTFPFGNRKGAVSAEAGEVLAVNPGFKVGEHILQMLGHLSQIFMNQAADMEYQSMLVNDRVLVAANAQTRIRGFRDAVLQEFLEQAAQTIIADNAPSEQVRPYKIGAVSEALKRDPGSTDPMTRQQTDGANMLAEYEFGHHVDHGARKDIRSMLNFLQQQARNRMEVLGPFDPGAAAAYITSNDHRYSVILVEVPTQTGWHAEQALAMALVNAGWTGGASVSGTKVPCYVCWLTLNLLPQCGYPLVFTQTPGFVWESNTLPALTHVAKALGIRTVSGLRDCFVRAQVHTGDVFRQFMTAMSEQTDLEVDVRNDDLGPRGRMLRNDISQRSFYVGDFTDAPTQLTGAPYPAQAPEHRVGDYGTPPGSPGGQEDARAWAAYEQQAAEYEIELAAYKKWLAEQKPDGNAGAD